MWVLFAIFLVLWIASVQLALPTAVVVVFFSMVVGSAAVAMMPDRNERIEIDRE